MGYRGQITVVLFLFLSLGFTQAQDSDLGIPEASFFAIIVVDIDTSLDWYQRVLKFEIDNQTDNVDYGFRQANLHMGGLQLELIELKNAVSSQEILNEHPPKTKLTGLFKLGVKVNAIEGWMNHFTIQKVKTLGSIAIDPITNKKMIIILDPDGNRIQVFEK